MTLRGMFKKLYKLKWDYHLRNTDRFMRYVPFFSLPFSLNCFFPVVEPLLMLTAWGSHPFLRQLPSFIFKFLALQQQMLLIVQLPVHGVWSKARRWVHIWSLLPRKFVQKWRQENCLFSRWSFYLGDFYWLIKILELKQTFSSILSALF